MAISAALRAEVQNPSLDRVPAGCILHARGTEGWEADLACSTAEGVGGFRISGNPEIRKIRNSGNPEIRKFGNPDIRKSRIPDIRRSRLPEIWKSGIPASRKSGIPEVR